MRLHVSFNELIDGLMDEIEFTVVVSLRFEPGELSVSWRFSLRVSFNDIHQTRGAQQSLLLKTNLKG